MKVENEVDQSVLDLSDDSACSDIQRHAWQAGAGAGSSSKLLEGRALGR